jgi:hypothetical protein
VICAPVLAELVANYRREVLLSSALAAKGIAVLRFHYRGTGHSDGSSAQMTFDSMCADALVAARHLGEKAGTRMIAFAGTRLGGLVAASAGAQTGDSPLVLWEPALDATRYFRDVYRAYLMNNLKENESTSATARSLADELSASDSFDLLGYSIDRPLYESSLGRSLEEGLGVAPRSILLAQIGPSQKLKSAFADLQDRLAARGFRVKAHAIIEREAWWLTGDQWRTEETREGTRSLVNITSDWLAEEFAKRGVSA